MQSDEPIPEPLQSFTTTASIAARLAELDVLVTHYRSELAAGRVLPNTIDALRVEMTYHSNALEGNTLSLRETQLVIEGKSPGSEKDLREIYEARNHDRALRLIEGRAKAQHGSPDEVELLEVHSLVLADIDLVSAGRYRSGRVLISGTGYVPPGSQKFDVLMPALFALADRPGVHPVIRSAEFHYNLVAVHPFNDGNGRTARLMMNSLLLRNAYPFAIINVAKRGEYLAALDEANHGRTEPFISLIIDSLFDSTRRIVG
jgi:Fic family protein